MKTITATSIILSLIYLSTQVASSSDFRDQSPNELQLSAVVRALDAVKFGLQTLRRGEKHIKRTITLENVGLVRAETKTCNFTDVESKFSQLVEVTVDFINDASASIEAILDKANICANASFPKSISCFLNLVKNCQPDVDAIKKDFQEFNLQSQSLASKIIIDIAICYHW